jgi:hypothetical protein
MLKRFLAGIVKIIDAGKLNSRKENKIPWFGLGRFDGRRESLDQRGKRIF